MAPAYRVDCVYQERSDHAKRQQELQRQGRTDSSNGPEFLKDTRQELLSRKSLLYEAETEELEKAEQEVAKECSNVVQNKLMLKGMFEAKEGNPLKAWLRHFDANGDMKITFSEFCGGMQSLGYHEDVVDLFRGIDIDGSGYLSLEEIDQTAAAMWIEFRRWSVTMFHSGRDMLLKLSNGGQTLDRSSFQEGIKRLGWPGCGLPDEMLFESMDIENLGFIGLSQLKWFEHDKKRQERKEKSKAKAMKENNKKAKERLQCFLVLQSFKEFLKKKFSSYLRAWRLVLDVDGSMSVQRHELFKAVSDLGWHGDVRLLWRALDKDDSGTTSLEEFDLVAASQLAALKDFIETKFGNASNAFKVFDRFNSKKLKYPEFMGYCKGHGFKKMSKSLLMGLDFQTKKFITESDMLFLDHWRAPLYLIREPNPEAANAIKNTMLMQYDNFLKAWKLCLDTDNSNRVNWREFETAAKKLKFTGDVAGAWKFLDDDMSGFITLAEIDQECNDILVSFKRWCDEEFGGVRSAFSMFDADGSNEVNFKEFRQVCKEFGYDGDAKHLFDSLDADRQKLLSLNEVVFLDEWDIEGNGGDVDDHTLMKSAAPKFKDPYLSVGNILYQTTSAGPGTYDLPTFGDAHPTKRNAGIFSFQRRPWKKLPSLCDPEAEPSSSEYDILSGVKFTSPRKPHYKFPTEPREVCNPKGKPSKVPSPGHYEANASPMRKTAGPSWTFTPRRTLVCHPLEKALSKAFQRPLPLPSLNPVRLDL
eukprot:gnl/MRDRNA2_/MRDRNA2_126214_c0_seq1.p1 gnl/MRDRNA2_/MRDRNA2_126214_c0~~gnl/MRDRNA2_/MRDRNA2_126214_c0_seq1.p1  ORF type:complete len:756 (-),score=177.25 gnl/MRDRNA2_/MRDRNA2_126214_c0_seq1:24-2291(-)